MKKQWGENPEYTFYLFSNFNDWAIPFNINWHYFSDGLENKCFSFGFRFLCFGCAIEIWKWGKQCKNSD